MENESEGVQVATRVDGATYAKILERQKEAERLTGVKPSVSAIVRAMLAESPGAKGKRR